MMNNLMNIEIKNIDSDNNNKAEQSFDMNPKIGKNQDSKNTLSNNSNNKADNSVKNENTEKKLPIGEKLLKLGLIDKDQLSVALHEKQQNPNKMMGEIMVELGFMTAEQLSTTLAKSAGFETFDPKTTVIDPEVLEIIDKSTAIKHSILPISIDRKKNEALIAMADPYNIVAMDKLQQILPRGLSVKPLVSTPAIISGAIDAAYGYATSVEGILKELAGEDPANIDIEDIAEEGNYTHPIVRLVNAIVFNGVKTGASDIHIEPEENFIRVRYRKDGILSSAYILHKEYWNAISQRLKIMSGMNIADKLMPQDGRFSINIAGREADFRVSSLPTVHGENIVLRILDKSAGIIPLEKLGFSPHNLELIKKAQAKPEGIIIVTGPTGSGKTTSLYSMLNEANTIDVNIMTLEDPVEYAIPMLRQASVREGAGLTFGDGVKALLRQDPDIIFVGEVRDEVTAEQALKAAMTGHQVYTTLHTNDCFGAIPRLRDLKLKPGMLAGAIIASFAQRLVRVLCNNCKEKHIATKEECKLLDIDKNSPPEIYHAVGCNECDNTGYAGRTAVVEILFMDEELNDIVAQDGHKTQLKEAALKKGFKSMRDDAVMKILAGITTIEAAKKSVDFSDRM